MFTENKNKKETRAAIYLRESIEDKTKAKEDRYGLIVQEESAKAYCKSQGFIWNQEWVYKDEGFSGTLPIEERPALKKLFEDAKEKKFDMVLVHKADRMARNLRILVNAVYDLKDMGISFCSVTQALDTSTSAGRAFFNQLATFAEFERDIIVERMQGGRKRAAKDGKWVWGSPPYGYRLNKDKELVIHEKEAKWVRTLFKWLVAEKLPLSAIHKRANEMNMPCYALKKRRKIENKGYWHKSSIARILCNPIYTGTDEFYRYKNGKKRLSVLLDVGLQRDKTEWVSFKTKNIISKTQFKLAREQLLKNREMADRNLKNVYLFNKLLYCGKCGFKLFAGNRPPRKETQNMFRFYHGSREPKWKEERTVKNSRCHLCGGVGEARLYLIWDTIKKLLERPEYMIDKLKDYDVKIPIEDTKEKIGESENRLKVVARKKKKIDQVYETSDTMDYAVYQKKIDECKREEERLRNEITLLNQKILRKDEVKANADHFRKLYDELQAQIQNATYEEKSDIIHLLVDKITFYKEEEMAEVRMKVPIDAPDSLAVQDVLGNQVVKENDVLCSHRIHRNTAKASDSN
ncbi:recombinase family protein [bacterium]|jgi:site-specific DNA recombinase|nr:recombinase family protein [bacterium]